MESFACKLCNKSGKSVQTLDEAFVTSAVFKYYHLIVKYEKI
jgi:hypothetical protein